MATPFARTTIPAARVRGVAALAALGLAALTAGAASAATPRPPAPAFALSSGAGDSAIRLRGAPGATLRSSLRVRNLGTRGITVALQPADIRNATNGNADYATAHPTQAGAWIDLDAASVRLGPGASRTLAFRVRVPARARGASHYAGIVAVDAGELAHAGAPSGRGARAGFTISRVNRQALPVTVRLPGPLTRGMVVRDVDLDVLPSGAALQLALKPSGSVLTESAHVRVRVSRGGRTVLADDTTLGQLFPGSRFVHRTPWHGRPTKGTYSVTGLIQPEDGAPVRFARTIAFTPADVRQLERETPPGAAGPGAAALPVWVWVGSAIAAALLLGLSVAVVRLRRRARELAG